MADIVVSGAGLVGLSTALLLGADGAFLRVADKVGTTGVRDRARVGPTREEQLATVAG
ncbi:MAG TPA: hypothetical protein VKG43_03105 [Acidimicrobiales bacterium]|nr:hypothetical protein [Acidimicrobiales bacterium]